MIHHGRRYPRFWVPQPCEDFSWGSFSHSQTFWGFFCGIDCSLFPFEVGFLELLGWIWLMTKSVVPCLKKCSFNSPLCDKIKVLWQVFFGILLGIWLERNNHIFRGSKRSSEDQVRNFGMWLDLIRHYGHPLIKLSIITNWSSFFLDWDPFL